MKHKNKFGFVEMHSGKPPFPAWLCHWVQPQLAKGGSVWTDTFLHHSGHADLPGISQILSWLCQEDGSSLVLTHVSESRRDISCPCLVVFSAQLTCLSVRRCWEDQVEVGQSAEPGSQSMLSESISVFLGASPYPESTGWTCFCHLPGSSLL